jgi:hypothetical protein
LTREKELRQPQKKPYQRWYRLLYASIVRWLQKHFKIRRVKQMVILIRTLSIENHPILLILISKHGHQELFNSLQVFIQQFLKEKLSFLTFLLYDQLSNHRFYYQHQREIQIPKPNEHNTINKRRSLVLNQ